MRARSKKMVMTMVVMVVMVVVGYTSLSLSSPAEQTNTLPGRRGRPLNPEEKEEEERWKIIKEEEEEKNNEEEEGEEGRGPPPEEEILTRKEKEMIEIKKTKEEMGKEKKKEEVKGGRGPLPEEKKKEENKKKEEKKTKEGMGGGGGGGGEGKRKIIRKDFWVDEMEVFSPSTVNMEEMEEEMRKRRRRVEERCGEILTEEERQKEINSMEFLISKKYKLVWCNIFKAASSTWMYNFLRMAGKSPAELQNLRASPVEAARNLYPRPSLGELRGYLGKSLTGDEDTGTGDTGVGEGGMEYMSFVIVRDPFQRFLSAYRDKIEKDDSFYRTLRCKITQKYGRDNVARKSCSPTFPQFVDYVLGVEGSGGHHNEHWAPYYRFCTPCSAHFDLILRFESLEQDETYLLQKVPGLSDVVSPKRMHSSHSNYTTILDGYYRQLSPVQMLGLVKMYLPDFWLFGYNERPYLDLVL